MKKSTILRGIFVCISLAFVILAYELNSKYSLDNMAIKTNSTPITNRIIVLDAGHGLPDEGFMLLHKGSNQLILYR